MEYSVGQPGSVKWWDIKPIPISLKVVYLGTDYVIAVPTEDSVRAVHDLVHDLYYKYTRLGKVDLEKLEDVMNIIAHQILLNGENKLLEWENLLEALKMYNVVYAYHHPSLWNFKKRLVFFGDVYSRVTSTDYTERSIAYKAVIDTNIFDDDWKVRLDVPHEAPLKRVFEKYGNVFVIPSDASREEKRWARGREMIFFMKNCVDYLTEVEIGPLNVGCYKHIDFMSDDPLYMDIEFFNHIVTHFLYPKLWIELYAALYIAGYKF